MQNAMGSARTAKFINIFQVFLSRLACFELVCKANSMILLKMD